MKQYSYSKMKVNSSARLIFGIFFIISLIIYLKSGFIFIFFLPIILTFHYTFLIHRVLTIKVYNEYIIVRKRAYWFYYRELKIVPDKGIYQYWEYTIDIRGKGNVYSIKQNSYMIFKLNSIDEWETETVKDLIKEVASIGIPLKGNLKDTII